MKHRIVLLATLDRHAPIASILAEREGPIAPVLVEADVLLRAHSGQLLAVERQGTWFAPLEWFRFMWQGGTIRADGEREVRTAHLARLARLRNKR